MNVLMNEFCPDGLAYISPEQDANMAGTRVVSGDVLLNITGASIGRVCVVPHEYCPANVNQHVCIIRSDGTLIPEWISFSLSAPHFQEQILGEQAGATRQALTKSMIEAFELPAPDLPTQRRIAARLREQMAGVDAARKSVEEQRELLKALVSATIREGIAHPETEFRPVGEVMEEVSRGVGKAWSDFPVLGATRNGLAAAKEPVGKNPHRYKPIIPGTVFYNPMRITIGSIAMLDDGEAPGITSPDYVAVRPRDACVRSLWFYEWLRSSFGVAFISSLARGAVRERMLFSRLSEGDMPVPPINWQHQFEQHSRQVRQAINALNAQAEALEKLPAAYLRASFGGDE
jgi:type I restriction enzyme S subunit